MTPITTFYDLYNYHYGSSTKSILKNKQIDWTKVAKAGPWPVTWRMNDVRMRMKAKRYGIEIYNNHSQLEDIDFIIEYYGLLLPETFILRWFPFFDDRFLKKRQLRYDFIKKLLIDITTRHLQDPFFLVCPYTSGRWKGRRQVVDSIRTLQEHGDPAYTELLLKGIIYDDALSYEYTQPWGRVNIHAPIT